MITFDLTHWCNLVGAAGADIVYDDVMAAPGGIAEGLEIFEEGQSLLIGRALIRLREQHGIDDRQSLDAAGQAILDAFTRRVDLRIRARRSNVVAFPGGAA